MFQYSFTPVNLKDINAFALPGGPMFVNRGMIEAARSEGEVAGVMAHELAHVLLRHGTANATKAQGFQIGALAGAIAGAVIGGGLGQVISQGSQFGLGTWLMKYSREYEKQADLLGVADHGPRRLRPARSRAHVRDDREAGGQRRAAVAEQSPEPGTARTYIAEEARSCTSRRAQRQRRAAACQAGDGDVCRAAKSMAELERARGSRRRRRRRGPGVGRHASANRCRRRPRQYRTVRGGQLFQASVPSNWQAVSSNNRDQVRAAERPTATTTGRACSRTASSSASRAPRRAI